VVLDQAETATSGHVGARPEPETGGDVTPVERDRDGGRREAADDDAADHRLDLFGRLDQRFRFQIVATELIRQLYTNHRRYTRAYRQHKNINKYNKTYIYLLNTLKKQHIIHRTGTLGA